MSEQSSNASINSSINDLIAEEHELRNNPDKSDENRQRLRSVEAELDQCWDLLRQRRSKAEFGDDPDQAHVRPAAEVENYRN
ncbi:DUF2630 family protein [Tersicoccus sp. Bi-70]|uniref:DUF2630 family protein n=1 Tax=Tersicoccus sp. Bi-70 TaxID=1897634 RepID=UPI0009757EA0|nr:DUF2630 family protein [Tersicoccus sp. Bi-70]OMH36893.1 hypothetical protein BGP79_14240 [Tersicoccus sp. Bi-70]